MEAHEQQLKPKVAGATTIDQLRALIKLAYGFDGKTIQKTAYHEAFHVAASWLPPPAHHVVSFPAKDEAGLRERVIDLLNQYEAKNLKSVVIGYETKEPKRDRHSYWNGDDTRVVFLLEMIKHNILDTDYASDEGYVANIDPEEDSD